jgi:hypothetical protein
MVKHSPILNVEGVCEYYSAKDGVPIKYVCTTSLTPRGRAYDIFFRDTPHPQFGNRYFGLFKENDGGYITGADSVEELTFHCIEGKDGWEYSSHVHDFKYVGDNYIDGGRSYTRLGGNTMPRVKSYVVHDGRFVVEMAAENGT